MKNNKTNKPLFTTRQLTKISICAALYFVVTMACKPFVFGPVEFRLSEMFNFLMFVDPIYVVGVTLGCAISNFFTFGVMDVFFGAGSTAIVGILIWKTKKMWPAIFYCTAGVGVIAWELWFFFGYPFWYQYGIGAFGEFISMILGYILARRLFKEKHVINLLKETPGNNKKVLDQR